MQTYIVHVIIENKPNISDPEGDTILNDLVLKNKNPSIKKIRVGKMLKFTVEVSILPVTPVEKHTFYRQNLRVGKIYNRGFYPPYITPADTFHLINKLYVCPLF